MLTLAYSNDRAKSIDYTYPHIIDNIVFTSPLTEINTFIDLLKPFDTYVWILSLITIIIYMLIFKYYFSRNDYWNIFKVKLLTTGSLSSTRRVIISYWFIFMYMLSMIYSQVVYSLISVPKTNSIESISELHSALEQGDINLYMYNQFPFKDLIKV